MGKKTLIPEEKWEGLRHAMEEAAGTRKTPKTPGLPPAAEGEEGWPARGKKPGAGAENKKEGKVEKEKGKKREKKEKKGKKKGKKGKGKKKKSGKKKRKGKG